MTRPPSRQFPSHVAYAALIAGALCPFVRGQAEWTVLKPVAAISKGGATMSVQPDGSVLVTGAHVEGDEHTVRVDTQLARITGFRIEALPHAQLPAGGPGRDRNGHFQLAELRVAQTLRAGSRRPRPLAFVDAVTKSPDVAGPVYHAVDGNIGSAWGSRGNKRHARVVFVAADPVDGDPKGSRLTFTLVYPQRSRAQMGCFRLSVTGDPQPLRGMSAPLSEGWAAVQMRINQAIDQGVDRLLAQQELDGSWRAHAERYPSGQTALSLYALLHAGVGKNELSVRRAIEFVRAHPPRRTYEAACQVLALCALNDPVDKTRIKQVVDKLVSWQAGYGGYGYPEGAIDLSNTHYAALSLWVAAKNGYRVPSRVWDRLAKVTIRHQEPVRGGPVTGGERPAGFRYRDNGQATGSMTAAGVTILGICEHQIRRKRSDIIRAKNQGLEWMRQHFSQSGNPQPSRALGATVGNLHYYLYAMERVGAILDMTHFGAHDWYRKGAQYLVDKQQPNGSWQRNQSHSCFALLFLTKATSRLAFTGQEVARGKRSWGKVDANAPLSIKIAGEAPHGMWVLAWGAKTVEQHGHGVGEKKQLRVAKVDYWAAPASKHDDSQRIASIAGDAKTPLRDQRFAAQHQFMDRGEHVIWARATLVKPDGAEVTVDSPKVRLTVMQVPNEFLLQYAGDPGRNRLAGARVKVQASSEHGPFKAARAVDNLQALAWRSAPDDPMPWLSIELAKPVKANTILLSHIQEVDQQARRRAVRIRRIKVEINGGKRKVFEIEMGERDSQKTVFQLPKTMSVKTLLLSVLAVRRNGDARGGVGLAEVELQLRK